MTKSETLPVAAFLDHALVEIRKIYLHALPDRAAQDHAPLVASLIRLREDCERCERAVQGDRNRWAEDVCLALADTDTRLPGPVLPRPDGTGTGTKVFPEDE